MSDWDEGVNLTSLTQEERIIRDRVMWEEQRAERDRRRGHIQLPNIPVETVRANFPMWLNESPDSWSNGVLATLSANRLIWMCHNCGQFGYKYSITELFKCYGSRCGSRNITVCRAGEMSEYIRGIRTTPPGVNMQDIFVARQERMRAARIARRTLA